MLIESIYIDGDDTHDSWRAMGETAKQLIEQNRELTDRESCSVHREFGQIAVDGKTA